ncbi:MAG: LysR family transcriptional regulator [Bryobacterales bacterium]|nr:LysR family transcriptional regulator [Bryobacterales bacterium]
MEFREARSLAVLAKVESLAKTAEMVNLTPAAVHKQLKNLESELGVVLYEKTGRTVHLTEAARLILPHLEEMLAQYRALTTAVSEWKGLKRGTVRVGANPAISSYLLPPLLRRFRRRWPQITPYVEVSSNKELEHAVVNRTLDLAVTHGDMHGNDRLEVLAAWEYDIVLVTRMSEVPGQARLAALAEYPMIQLPEGNQLGDAIRRYQGRHGLRPAELLVVNNSHTMISMVRAGLGVAALPGWSVAADVRAGRLRVVEQEEEPLVVTLSLIVGRGGYVAPAVQAFLDLVRGYESRYLRRVG